MTHDLPRAAAALSDLAHALEAADDPVARIQHAAEQIRQLLRSDACVFASVATKPGPSVVVVPALPVADEERLGREARALLAIVLDHRDGPRPVSVRRPGDCPHLAVPLIAAGEVAGLVLVERTRGAYAEHELQLLAIAASQLGAFLAVLRAREEALRGERAVAEALALSRAADEAKARFLSVLSHELRNPLAPLRNAAYLLEHADPGAESARRARAIIGRQVEHLARLVDDLLDVTRISTGKVHLQRAPIDLVETVRHAVEDHRPLFLQSGIALEAVLPASPLWIDGDGTRIAQVVGNLLSNAQKFTLKGGHVAVSLAREGDATAAIRVRDDGVGMSSATLERLFEQFAQGADTLDRSHGGLGLGLALAKGLVALHGGTIDARSDGAGRGSELVVRLPLLPAANPAGAPG